MKGFLGLRCPVCERARVFRGYFDTPEKCPECGYFFMRETGYFLPHTPIGYIFTVGVSLAVWLLLEYGFGVRSSAAIIGAMIAAGAGFGIWFARYAKMIWLAIDLRLHPPTQEDFLPRGRQTNRDASGRR
ncbi:MAG TPA: hypothetical protein VFY29_00365 [Terriglobia bacterium]|nr:hypothetical protein [Terriglobia bacterium]